MSVVDMRKYLIIVAQRVLSAQMEKAEQNQHHKLFQTRFIVKERACHIIIDSESCSNLTCSDLVDKLGLTTHPHPHLYSIEWFNSCGKLKVSRVVRVQFLVGIYRNSARFAVMFMKTCSLLLDRP
ncbi:hypothetical protein GUJ93_ZPchr0001g30975 [Zizania palustris]|uniref:Uncharacterized protein n=1 Tax=Zizania palustris TaxID=103762 RepID=A0A8J5RPC1_ZIZPA|nr:hypothetical protein GUJ93_ZPchr0001g30975 [Zizania palustris]